LTANQTIIQKEFRNVQTHQHKWTCKNKKQQICRFQYPKPLMKCTKTLLCSNEKEYNSNLYHRGTQISNKLVDIGLSLEISFDEFIT
jgi:hypothetical protein